VLAAAGSADVVPYNIISKIQLGLVNHGDRSINVTLATATSGWTVHGSVSDIIRDSLIEKLERSVLPDDMDLQEICVLYWYESS
jgi:hypothetical protein